MVKHVLEAGSNVSITIRNQTNKAPKKDYTQRLIEASSKDETKSFLSSFASRKGRSPTANDYAQRIIDDSDSKDKYVTKSDEYSYATTGTGKNRRSKLIIPRGYKKSMLRKEKEYDADREREHYSRYGKQPPSYLQIAKEKADIAKEKAGNAIKKTFLYRAPIKRSYRGSSYIPASLAKSSLSFLSGQNVPIRSYSKSKGYSRPGRPKGTVKYYVPGVGPVGVFEYRKYKRAKDRALAMTIQQRNPQVQYNEAIQIAKQQINNERQEAVQSVQQNPVLLNEPKISYQPQPAPGWGLLSIKMPSIGLSSRPVDPVNQVQAPLGNKYTAYYSEPNFLSGTQTMRRRPDVGGFGLW